MTQLTQFLVEKASARINVQPSVLATYLAAGWAIIGLEYSEGAESVDNNTQFLMVKGPEQIHAKAKDVQTYQAAGWTISRVFYGSAQTEVNVQDITYLDVPALASAEIGAVAATKVVVTFSTEVSASNYATGVTIKVNTVSKTISAAQRQTDHKVVHYTIPEVIYGDAVTWEYSSATGLMLSENDSSPLDSISAQEVTNNVADTPEFGSAEVGTVDATTVAVEFSTDVAATNYATGVTIKVNDVSKTISAAERQTDHKVVYYTIPAVVFGDTVTWEYSATTGLIESENDETPLGTVPAQAVTNNVAEE